MSSVLLINIMERIRYESRRLEGLRFLDGKRDEQLEEKLEEQLEEEPIRRAQWMAGTDNRQHGGRDQCNTEAAVKKVNAWNSEHRRACGRDGPSQQTVDNIINDSGAQTFGVFSAFLTHRISRSAQLIYL